MTNDEVLNAFANKMLTAVEGIEAFGKEQIPDYIEQVLLFNFCESALFGAISLLFFLSVLITMLFGVFKGCDKGWGYETPSKYAIIVMVSAVLLIPAIPVFCHGFLGNLEDAIKIKVAPKMYIVDYLRGHCK